MPYRLINSDKGCKEPFDRFITHKAKAHLKLL